MSARLLALGIAPGPYCIKQREASEYMLRVLGCNEREKSKLSRLYEGTQIARRYSVLPEFSSKRKPQLFTRPLKMQERNAIYKKEAPLLAQKAARNTLDHWGESPEKITHVISVSCTGIFAPGLEFTLIETLGLKASTQRLGLNFMGCFGAFRALALASALAEQNPQNRILIVCTELCTLHFQIDKEWQAVVSSALFSDGSAAAIVGCEKRKGLARLEKFTSLALRDSFEEMQWDATEYGLVMRLTRKVPQALKEHVFAFHEDLIKKLEKKNCVYPLHPGGPAILQGIEKRLSLQKDQTASSWKILKEYGNMSSASLLFVLHEMLQKKTARPYAAAMGFGPGLSMEGLLLKML